MHARYYDGGGFCRIGSWSDGCASNGRCFASLPSHLPIAATSNHNNTHTHDDSGSITSDGKYNFGYDATAMMTSLTGIDRNERYLYTAGDERLAVVRIAVRTVIGRSNPARNQKEA
jgi:hypothetical protein